MALTIADSILRMPLFAVRQAARRDVPAIVALWKEMMAYHAERDSRFQFNSTAIRELERHLIESMRSRDSLILVADAGQGVVGYILGEMHTRRPLYPIGTYGFISDICVLSDWRRHGIGKALVEAALEWFRKKRATSVELFVAETNPESQAFWDSMNFGSFLQMRRREL